MQVCSAAAAFAHSMAEHLMRDKFQTTELLMPAADHIFEDGAYYRISGNGAKGWSIECGAVARVVKVPFPLRLHPFTHYLAALTTRPEEVFSRISKVEEAGKKKLTDREILDFVDRKVSELEAGVAHVIGGRVAQFRSAVAKGPIKKEPPIRAKVKRPKLSAHRHRGFDPDYE